ncbi:MAG TPA: hypothetical protein VFD82_15965 [Planctomycetota bacterium]|nr:hypothetical protein [Planctomycetota bacterium]
MTSPGAMDRSGELTLRLLPSRRLRGTVDVPKDCRPERGPRADPKRVGAVAAAGNAAGLVMSDAATLVVGP